MSTATDPITDSVHAKDEDNAQLQPHDAPLSAGRRGPKRAELPFRHAPGLRANDVSLEYDDTVLVGNVPRKMVFRLYAGGRPYAHVLKLVQMYRNLEDELIKLREEVAQLRKEVKKAKEK